MSFARKQKDRRRTLEIDADSEFAKAAGQGIARTILGHEHRYIKRLNHFKFV
jgi:hypothetical protein